MKRLIKKANGNFTYKFKSPVTVWYGDDSSYSSYSEDLSEVDRDTRYLVKTESEQAVQDLGPKGLAEFIDNTESYYDAVDSIFIEVQEGSCISTVNCNRELNQNEIDEVKDYITGQFSDGWGEGFEQAVLGTNTVQTEEEFYDEEEGETYTETVEQEETITAAFWNSSNWSIQLI